MAAKKKAKKGIPSTPTAAAQAAGTPAAAAGAPAAKKKRERKGRNRDPNEVFAAKVRIEGIKESDMAALSLRNQTARRKTTRNDMKTFLTAACAGALTQLRTQFPVTLAPAAPAATPVGPIATASDDDLLS
jgi:hypothetical protein